MNVRDALPSIVAALAIVFTSGALAGERWDALWRTADQRGEQLLHDGKAADAAHTYRDPRRKAYAEMVAGDYRAAAQGFAAFDDSESQYNRGNALAHSGDLSGALKAYDAALALAPDNTDAKRNRDLVEKMLKQQQQKNSAQSEQQNKRQDPKDSQAQDQQQPSSNGQKQSDQKSSAQKNTSDQPQNGTPQTQTQNGAQNTEQNTKPASPQQQAPSKPQSRQADDKTRAEQDAQEAANAAAKSRQSGTDKPMQAIDAKTDEPKSEQQLAEEQWLRQIPDDPGGLLRRKFMIEHLMRQQQDQQQ